MDITITYADGMVRIQNIGYTTSSDQIDISAAPGEFVMEVSRAIPTNAALDSMTIWHKSGRRVCSFAAHEISIPAGPDIDTLIPLVDAILTQSSGGTTLTPINTIYVSGVNGSPTGNGSIAEPVDTIAAGITLAATNSATEGIAWCVYVYSGTYDEQILVPTTADPICITLGCGAEVIFSSPATPTVDATNGDTYITMQQGSVLANTGSGAVLYPDVNNIVIIGNGTIRMDSPYQVVDMTKTGGLTLRDTTLLNTDPGNTVEMINQTGGVLRMVNVNIVHESANDPMVKSGGDARLYACNIYAPLSTNSIASPTRQNVQVVNCVSNLATGVNITETVGTLLVDAAFEL